jgi:hypothetical protein
MPMVGARHAAVGTSVDPSLTLARFSEPTGLSVSIAETSNAAGIKHQIGQVLVTLPKASRRESLAMVEPGE